MFSLKKVIILILLVMTAVIPSTSCNKRETLVNKNIDISKYNEYSNTMVLEEINSKILLYSLKDNKLTETDNTDIVSELAYDIGNKVYTFLIKDEKNLGKNFIQIVTKTRNKTLNDFYYAKDLRMSQNGRAIAYRTFKTQSIDSAEGLKLYSIEKNSQIDTKSNVILSGDVYKWISDKEIAYYGILQGNERKMGIFKYNIETHMEDIYIDNIPGYCMYFAPIGKKTLTFSRTESDNILSVYDLEKNEHINVNNNIENIYSDAYDKKNNIMYFIAEEKYSGVSGLYRLDLNTYVLDKLNYDFPKVVDPYGNINLDNKGIVYYCGYSNVESNENDIFMYNPEDNSNTIITIKPSKYKIFGDSTYQFK